MQTNIKMKTVVCAVIVFMAAGIGGFRTPEAAENGSEEKHEWPMVAGNAGWTGYSPDPSAKPPFRLKWVTQPGRKVGATLAVAGGRVFYRGGGCLDSETGEILWKVNIGVDPIPTYYKGRLYMGARRSSRVAAYDAATGKCVWRKSGYKTSRDYRAALTVCDGAVYVGKIKDYEGKKFYFGNALDTETGKEIWSTPLAAVVEVKPRGYRLNMTMGSPAVGGGRVFFSSHSPKGVYAVDQKTGKKLWTREGVCDSSELGTDGKTVWAAQAVQGMWALDAKTGKKLWHWGREWKKNRGKSVAVQANYAHINTAKFPPVVAYGMLFTSNYGRQYTALDQGTGKKLWVAGDRDCQGWAGTCGRPTAAAGYVYTSGTTGRDFNGPLYRFAAYAFDPEARKVVWKRPVSGKACARVSIAYGRLYVPTPAEIYCFEAVPADYEEPKPQPVPSEPAAPLSPLAKPFPGAPGTIEAAGKPESDGSWPMYGGCPARCGLDVKIGLPIKEVWKFQTGGRVKSSPVIWGGHVFAGNDSGRLFALDLSTGKEKWSAEITVDEKNPVKVKWIRSAPAVADGIVVVGADDGVMRAFDVETGKPKWQFRTAGRIRSSPAIVGDRVLFGSWDGRCYCVRLSDGKEYWRWRIGDPGVRLCTPVAAAQGRVYINAWEDFKVHAVDLGTGKPLEGYKALSGYGTKMGLVQGLAIYRGAVVTSKAAGLGQPINPDTGTVVGRGFGRGSSILPSLPAFHADMVYHNRSVRGASLSEAFSKTKKKKKYRRVRFRNSVLNAILVCGDLVIGATAKGTMEAYRISDNEDEKGESKDTGRPELVWEWKSASGAEIHTAPAAAGGHIVMGSDDGHIYAFSYSESPDSTARAASEKKAPVIAEAKKAEAEKPVQTQTAAAQESKKASGAGKPALRLLKKYTHKGTNGDRYSEGLDFYKGYLWHTTKTGLSKLDPDNNFAVVNTWKFTHQTHTESAVWFKGVLYNFTYQIKRKKDNSIFTLTLNSTECKAEMSGRGLGETNWGSCRDSNPLKPGTESSIIYTAEGKGLDNQLLWYDPVKKETIKKVKITGVYRIEDLGMDRYGTIWASSYHKAYRNRFFRIDPEAGKVIQTFDGPKNLKSRIIDGIAIRSFKDHDVMYVTGKHSQYIYEYEVPSPPETGPKG